MKTHRWFIPMLLSLVLSLVLSACGAAATPQPTPPPAATPTQPAAPGYPVPGVDSSQPPAGYPDPGQLAVQPQEGQAGSLYPELKSGDQLDWYQATTLIKNGEVTKVTQAHDLKVTLSLADGRTLVTVEPLIDEVMKVIQECGDPCKSIQAATE